MSWFTLLDEPLAPGSANWGLMQSDGTPKPSYNAFKASA
jgi:hypothetical protein